MGAFSTPVYHCERKRKVKKGGLGMWLASWINAGLLVLHLPWLSYMSKKSKLVADNSGILLVPEVVTDCPPDTIVVDFNPTLH